MDNIEDYSDYEIDGIKYDSHKELRKWTKLRLMEANCNNCCSNIFKILSVSGTRSPPRSPPRYVSIFSKF